MGGQNAVVRRLAVPDLTTTVLTMTVIGLVADTSWVTRTRTRSWFCLRGEVDLRPGPRGGPNANQLLDLVDGEPGS
jgi:hypothetical protein